MGESTIYNAMFFKTNNHFKKKEEWRVKEEGEDQAKNYWTG